MKQKLIIIAFFLLFKAFDSTLSAQLGGTILDGEGEPVIGATILEHGTTNFTLTEIDGKFNLKLQGSLPAILEISAVGYYRQEIDIFELPEESLDFVLKFDNLLSEVVVTARRRTETAQDVPIPITIFSGAKLEESGAFNVNRLKELVPSVQMYASNPRNTGINIRGLGSPFGLTNDGLDPGVGFYIDGVYFARPAAAALDFIDVDRIEVLRGPQGTLFGKNTTSGAFNITTKKPDFKPGAAFEVSYGNFGYIQAKSSITGAIIKDKLAGRVSFSGTQRDGTIYNFTNDEYVNDINNLGFRAQLLFTPNKNVAITLAGDNTSQNPNGYAQVVAGVTPTQRPAYRQFTSIIGDLGYALPSSNAFDRIIDHDTPWRSLNELGGISLNADFQLGKGTLTSTTAWRYWNWRPSNDRDFTGLQALAKSQNPSEHKNTSQEIRYSSQISDKLSGLVGIFFIDQEVQTHGTEESGSAQWRFSQSTTSELWKTPGLLEGYGAKTESSIQSQSAALFANADWSLTERFHLHPGVRLNYDKKEVSYDRKASGGLETADPALIALKKTVYQDQFFTASANETNFTYLLTISYKAAKNINTYATFSTSYKPVGVNVAGLPVIDGKVAVDLGTIKPEYVKHFEAGIKTRPSEGVILNASFFNTDIDDYQTNVQSPQIGVNRGYIANAEKVNVKGAEMDLIWNFGDHFSFNGAVAYTDGKYVSFANAPLPLEETGLRDSDGNQLAFKDISGERLPGISKWSTSASAEIKSKKISFWGQEGHTYLTLESFYRSEYSSSSSPSSVLNIEGYGLLNMRAGFRASKGLSIQIWARNLTNKDYFEQLLAAGGSAGHYAGVLGDPRTFGATLRYVL